MSEQQPVTAITLAFISNLAFKFGMVVFIGGWNLARHVAAGFVAMICGVLLGFFGGLVSSTATTMIYAKHGKSNPVMSNLAASVIVIASMVVLLRLLVVSAVVAFGALPSLLPVVGGGVGLGVGGGVGNWGKKGGKGGGGCMREK